MLVREIRTYGSFGQRGLLPSHECDISRNKISAQRHAGVIHATTKRLNRWMDVRLLCFSNRQDSKFCIRHGAASRTAPGPECSTDGKHQQWSAPNTQAEDNHEQAQSVMNQGTTEARDATAKTAKAADGFVHAVTTSGRLPTRFDASQLIQHMPGSAGNLSIVVPQCCGQLRAHLRVANLRQ